ncbi:hypothetical protein DER45DRAFT_544958 [Fusarium avenaceum]|nr:hypothetical protein DER45DRAFT_544958 [Fusarium avenaceum]
MYETPQQRDSPATPEVNKENKQEQMSLSKTSFHIPTTTIRTDGTALSSTVTSYSPRAQFNQLIEHSKSSKIISHSGVFANLGDKRCNNRNSMTQPNAPILPQERFSQTSQVQALGLFETTQVDKNISTAVLLPLALISPNQSFIYTGAVRHNRDSEMEQHSISDEAIDKIRMDLARLGVELQENAREQIRCISEAEYPDITDISSERDQVE